VSRLAEEGACKGWWCVAMGAVGQLQRGRMPSLGCPRPSALPADPRRVAAAKIAAPQAASRYGCTVAAAARKAAAAAGSAKSASMLFAQAVSLNLLLQLPFRWRSVHSRRFSPARP
jgi:hypothetical protein